MNPRTKWSVTSFLIPLALVATMTGCGGATAGGNSTGGGSVSDFTLKDIDGNTVSLYQHATENVVVLSFWAPCCESGKQIMVDSQKLNDRFEGKNVVFMGIAVDEPDTRNIVRSYIKQRSITIPILIDEESAVMGRLNTRRVLPYTMVLKRGGDLAWTHEGYVPGDDALIEAAVNDALETM